MSGTCARVVWEFHLKNIQMQPPVPLLINYDLYLYFLCPGIEPFPQQPPAGQAVAIVTEVGLISAAHIDGDDRPGAHVPGYIGC